MQFLFREEKWVMLFCKPEPEPAETLLGCAKLFHTGTTHLRFFWEYFFQEPFLLLWRTTERALSLDLACQNIFLCSVLPLGEVMKALSVGNCRGCRQNKKNGRMSQKKKKKSVKSSPDKGQVCYSTFLTKCTSIITESLFSSLLS